MFRRAAFTVEPWCLREQMLDLEILAQSESLFALSNGHIGWRANLDEGEPHGLPGSYLNGVYEERPLPYAEAEYGLPESGQTMINVTNGKVIRLLVDDEPFDIRYGKLLSHERLLDFRAGTLRRQAEWRSPAGRTVRVTSVRLVSLAQRSVAAVSYEVEPLDGNARLVVQSELVANEQLGLPSTDPRAAAVLDTTLQAEAHRGAAGRATLIHRTVHSGLRIAVAMRHAVHSPAAVHQQSEVMPDVARQTISTLLEPGQRLHVVKFVAYGWSKGRSLPAMRDQVEGALAVAEQDGWSALEAGQRAYLDDFWGRADVEVDGDPEVQQAVRFGLFHLLQAGARAENRAIPAKGLTGTGYDGHAFWDTEIFVLPMLTWTVPETAAHALNWRASTLPQAVERARQLGLAGAAFPWRTINGAECSGYWPAGTAAFHVNADIAEAVIRYQTATADEEFARGAGLDLLVATARLWRSLGHHDPAGHFRIDGVTGPDEYSAIADNNIYTNLMAQQNMAAAADAAEGHPDRARELGVSADEIGSWRTAAAAVLLPYDEKLGVHQQAEGFTEHETWDFAATQPDQYPLMLHFPYFDLYRKQVVKQADLVLAMELRPEAFSAEQKSRNFNYYEALTVRDSSLSACTQAVMAAETGHLSLAYDYLGEAALLDLLDLNHNTRDGLHLASLAGAWIALVLGFGGMRLRSGCLHFAPCLPEALARMAFTIVMGGRRLRVETTASQVTYTLTGDGPPLEIGHHGQQVTLAPGSAQTLPVPAAPDVPAPAQPPGREPAHRVPLATTEAATNAG
ncbi:MAG TPA: glycosyl hydrolase family 65 protein [Streptosporangiaceae bacterium]|nr:glycosyl hydrolase family 65 protein [Streptosporangiaceae bacterium]